MASTPSSDPSHPSPTPPKKGSYLLLWVILGIAAVGILVNLVQKAGDDSPRSTAHSTTTTRTTPAIVRTTTPAAVPPSAPAPAAAPTTAAPVPPATPRAPAGIGRPYRDGKFEFIVNSWDGTTANITVKNIGDEPQFMNTSVQYLYDTQGRKFEPEVDLGSELFLTTLNPGQSASGSFSYVLSGATPAHLELHDSMFSGGVEVPLR